MAQGSTPVPGSPKNVESLYESIPQGHEDVLRHGFQLIIAIHPSLSVQPLADVMHIDHLSMKSRKKLLALKHLQVMQIRNVGGGLPCITFTAQVLFSSCSSKCPSVYLYPSPLPPPPPLLFLLIVVIVVMTMSFFLSVSIFLSLSFFFAS